MHRGDGGCYLPTLGTSPNKLLFILLFIGLPFAAFIEAIFCLSQRKFPSAYNLSDSVNHLVNTCTSHLNSTLQSPLILQSDQYFLHRTPRNNNTINSLASNIRSSTTAPIRRSVIATLPTLALKSHSQQIIPLVNIDDTTKSNTQKQSKKSVFPLFFDVL